METVETGYQYMKERLERRLPRPGLVFEAAAA